MDLIVSTFSPFHPSLSWSFIFFLFCTWWRAFVEYLQLEILLDERKMQHLKTHAAEPITSKQLLHFLLCQVSSNRAWDCQAHFRFCSLIKVHLYFLFHRKDQHEKEKGQSLSLQNHSQIDHILWWILGKVQPIFEKFRCNIASNFCQNLWVDQVKYDTVRILIYLLVYICQKSKPKALTTFRKLSTITGELLWLTAMLRKLSFLFSWCGPCKAIEGALANSS